MISPIRIARERICKFLGINLFKIEQADATLPRRLTPYLGSGQFE